MIRHYMEGVLFFGGGRELRVVASDVSRTSALLHVHGLCLLPVSFFVSFDGFLTVGKCRLTWRHRDDVGVVFERWIDVLQRVELDQNTQTCRE